MGCVNQLCLLSHCGPFLLQRELWLHDCIFMLGLFEIVKHTHPARDTGIMSKALRAIADVCVTTCAASVRSVLCTYYQQIDLTDEAWQMLMYR